MPQYPEQTRWLMIILFHSGMTIPEVAEALECDERTVERWITRFNNTLSVTALPRPGGPRKTSRDQDIDIVADIKVRTNNNQFKTAVDILNNSGLEVTAQTIRNRLRENGIRNFMAARKERVTAQHKQQRLAFAQQYRNFAGWERTIFSDESTFVTGNPHMHKVWREFGTRYEESNIQIVQNSGRAIVCVWAAISRNELGPIVRINGHFDRFKYIDIMEEIVKPYYNGTDDEEGENGEIIEGLEGLFGENFHFIQDRSPI